MAKTRKELEDASSEINRDKKGNIVGQVLTQKGNNGAGNEVFVGASQSVQKGFSNNELRAYLQDALGDGFNVEAPNFKAGSGATAIATKKEIKYSEKTGEEGYFLDKNGNVVINEPGHFG